jgi:adenylate cyclase
MRSKLKQFWWKTRGAWIATPIVAGAVILLRASGALQGWEWTTYDLYTRLRPPEPPDRRILIVGINEKDVSNLQASIIPDRTLAELLQKIKLMKPRAIGLDMYRDLPVPPGHDTLAEVFRSTPNLAGVRKVAGEIGRETVAPPPILEARGQVGANDLPIDADNTVRRGLLYLNDGKSTVYALALHLAGHYLKAEGISIEPIPGTQNLRIGRGTFAPLEADDGGYVRADTGGFQFLVNYRSGAKSFDTVSMTDILAGKVPPALVRDRIVLIGKVGESFKDFFFTPYSPLFGLSRPIPGVEIHAHLTSQILGASLDDRPLIKTWPEAGEWLWIFFWSGVGAIISWRFRYTEGKKFYAALRWGALAGAGAILFGATYGAFLAGWWLPAVPPFLALAGSAIAITAYIARTAVNIRKTFGRYLTDQVVANLLENPAGLQMGGERREITILTSDLRGFTSLAERLPPEEVIEILNFYFGRMADTIARYGGTIDEFMGDGILVLFGAPTKSDDDAVRAIACAVKMQLSMETVNRQMDAWGFPALEMGIAIHTGEVVVGNIGSEKRTKYGVVGAQVNLTYRIESYTTGGQILISETTLRRAGGAAIVNGQREVLPKGLKQPIVIYDVIGVDSPYHLRLLPEEEIFFPLEPPIPLRYSTIDGKRVGEEVLFGNLVRLSAKGGEVVVEHSERSKISGITGDIRLNFFPVDRLALMEEDVYAKVVGKPSESDRFTIRFTARTPAIDAWLISLYTTLKKKRAFVSIEENKA